MNEMVQFGSNMCEGSFSVVREHSFRARIISSGYTGGVYLKIRSQPPAANFRRLRPVREDNAAHCTVRFSIRTLV